MVSFLIVPPIQALRGLPCLGSFSVIWCLKHIEGLPWLGSYSVAGASGTERGTLGGVLLCSTVCQAVWWARLSIVQLLAHGER